MSANKHDQDFLARSREYDILIMLIAGIHVESSLQNLKSTNSLPPITTIELTIKCYLRRLIMLKVNNKVMNVYK